MPDILFKEESYKIIGACFEVYNQKGYGFTEPIYQECLEIEFMMQGVPFVAQPIVELEYKGRPLTQCFKPDFVCYDKIIVEIKSVATLVDAHKAQTLNYLNATKFGLALLVNFGQFPNLAYERLANNRKQTNSSSITDDIRCWGLK